MPSNEIKNKKKYPWTKTKLCNDDFTHPLSFRYDVHVIEYLNSSICLKGVLQLHDLSLQALHAKLHIYLTRASHLIA